MNRRDTNSRGVVLTWRIPVLGIVVVTITAYSSGVVVRHKVYQWIGSAHKGESLTTSENPRKPRVL
jgi:hypothetical protein